MPLATMYRLLPLAHLIAACALALASCGSASVELTGAGLLGKRFGSDARTGEAAIVEVLGKPTARMEFDGCELGGPGAREQMSTVRWGALGVRYENRKTASGYEPSKLVSWEIHSDGEIPSGVKLPGGVGRGATFSEVRDAVGVRREAQDFESNLIATSRDGVEYWFDAPAHAGRVQGIASRIYFCE